MRERERAPVLAKGSVQRIVCKGIRAEEGLQACGARGEAWGRTQVVHAQGCFEEGSAMEAGLFLLPECL